MSSSCEHSNPLILEGTNQISRAIRSLLPENVKLHELTDENWLIFAKDLAQILNFFELTDEQNSNGDWDNFFPEKDEIDTTLSQYLSGTVQPHLALFLAFLKLLEYPQKSLNNIPKRHLEFYYKEILQLKPRAFNADTVHIIIELAKNAVSELVTKDSLLEAGKDDEGNLLQYKIDNDFVANQAKIVQIHSLYLRQDHLLFSENPKTIDGLQEELEQGDTWSAFGNNNWPLAKLEFALAGKIFNLKEGVRTITLNWDINNVFKHTGRVFASLTTEKGWTNELKVIIDGDANNRWQIILESDLEPITPYNHEVHLLGLNTSDPVLKIRFEDPDMFKIASQEQVNGLTVDVDVIGVKTIDIKNELGKQLPDKPFMPFGPRPKKNSSFSLVCSEFQGKDVQSFNIGFNWLNTPPNFSNHYVHYQDAITAEENEIKDNLGYYTYYAEKYKDIQSYLVEKEVQFLDSEIGLPMEPDPMRSKFKIEVSSPYQSVNVESELFTVFPQVRVESLTSFLKKGEIEIRLKESFYHHLYNKLYVSVVIGAGNSLPPDQIPNEPYTPLVDSILIDYKATATITFGDSDVSGDKLMMFHLLPFGSKSITKRSPFLYPILSNTLLIGLENTESRDTVSILFQVAEGSENPLLSSFSSLDAIQWSVLIENDEWLVLKEDSILNNTTNNFLKSGIIQFSLPKNSSKNHSILKSGLIWLKAELVKAPSAVAKFIDLHTQATTASFFDQNNVYNHLNTGLPPETIKQLASRKSTIKKVRQPYSSKDGASTETDNDFYIRVSERLRHKDRAVTIWDYEHLTLQAFPSLYKVKCLNHTKFKNNSVDELAPGHVTLIVLPKIVDTNLEYRLSPTVSQNVKDQILKHLLPKKIMHTELSVQNPQYEPVEFVFKVKFHPQYDYNFYRGVLEKDLIGLLAPWAFNNETEILFNNTIYSFNVVNYIENLDYVDYLEDFIMKHYEPNVGWQVKKNIKTTTSMGILTSKSTHNITEALIC